MMRVIFVAGSARMGGTERNVLRLAAALLARGRKVEVVLLSDEGPLADSYRTRQVPVTSLGWSCRVRRFPSEFRRLAGLVADRKPDVVQSFGYPAIWWGTLAALEARGGGRVIAIQAWDTWKGRTEVALDRAQAPAVHLAIADGEGARRFAVEQQGLPPERTRTVYDGVDPAELAPTRPRQVTRASLGLSGEGPAIGVVARLDDIQKGQSVLLRAGPRILAEVPEATFILAGDGADRTPLENVAQALGVARHVRFPGIRTDLGDVLAALDLLVIPSLRFESVPKILLEAMATGLPVIASRVGDIPELLEDGMTGRLVPPGDPEALADAVLACLADRPAAQRLGAAARETVAAKGLTLEATAAMVDALYAELVAEGPLHPPPSGVRRRMWRAAWLYLVAQALDARRRRLGRRRGRPC
jgi:glycosyltransferase involved in cell wall biosynthesis